MNSKSLITFLAKQKHTIRTASTARGIKIKMETQNTPKENAGLESGRSGEKGDVLGNEREKRRIIPPPKPQGAVRTFIDRRFGGVMSVLGLI